MKTIFYSLKNPIEQPMIKQRASDGTIL